MQFQRLEKYSRIYPRLGSLIPQLDNYFGHYLKEVHSESWKTELINISIVPRNVAGKLGISEALALSLLGFADDEELVKPAYQVYCPKKDACIAEYSRIDDIPEKVYCLFDDKRHKKENFQVRLVFHFTQTAWEIFNPKNCLEN